MKFRVAVLLLLYKCLVFAPNVIFASESAVSGLPCPLKTCTDVLKELGATEKQLKDLEIRLAKSEAQIEEIKKEKQAQIEEIKQDLEIRLVKSEAQIEEIKKEKQNLEIRLAKSEAQIEEIKKEKQDYHHFTLDPNTMYRYLLLSEGSRVITRTDTEKSYPDHPERFQGDPQVLCRESVSNRRSYWEIEWSGDVWISVAYKSISRKGPGNYVFGTNDQSWSLYSNSIWHNNIQTKVSRRFIISRTDVNGKSYYRTGVYVDHSAKTLSFYSISGDTMILIHTVQTTFTEPLYPGFRVLFTGSSVKLI
ncbi:stonustoxin subunit beta-like isoform X2 [Chanodichthys erythropterus]|uniref:stonustoxin subunit beta-like isoform X2 n=1 Tax=Chanodichthys erythropterus TaxID=933992 RepID=UPI00351E3EB2